MSLTLINLLLSFEADKLVVARFQRISSGYIEFGPVVETTEQKYIFDEADAWLDLWCHTVFEEPSNAFSFLAPTIQFGRYGAVMTLETLGRRWNWEKTKVWRFFQKYRDAFVLHRLPGSYGCLIFNMLYPTDTEVSLPESEKIERIIAEIRILGKKTQKVGSDSDHSGFDIGGHRAWPYPRRRNCKTP
mgnify:CR=1 FL=1